MAVFEYTATQEENEATIEKGLIVARDKIEAFDKLRKHQLRLVHLNKLEGLTAFFRGFSANIR